MLNTYQKPLAGKRVGLVFGAFAPLHSGHLDLIYRAKKECDGGAVVISCGYDGDKGEPSMPHRRRYRYVREFFADDELVAVYSVNDTEIGAAPYPNGWEVWLKEVNRIWNMATSKSGDSAPEKIWFVGEPEYAETLRGYGETVVLVDREATNPIHATMIRQNPIRHWDKITFPFRRVFSANILICGTASEGKTTLTKDLGKYFNAPYSHEWARDYMEESCVADWELDGADYLAFLEGQYNLNRSLINSQANHGLFFSDTDTMVTQMYAKYYAQDPSCKLTEEDYQKIAVTAKAYIEKSRWDKVFLLAPNGVFVDDHTRFMAHSGMKERMELFDILCGLLQENGLWDKVTVLDGGAYYQNFLTIKNYANQLIENGKAEL